MSTELYYDVKAALLETIAIAPSTISFLNDPKQCYARPLDYSSFPGDSGGFVAEATTHVTMLDTDFDSWAGVGYLSTVELDGNELQIHMIRRKVGSPIIHLALRKDK